MTEPLKKAIFILYKNGMPQKNIAIETGLTVWFVNRAIKWCKKVQSK